LLGSPEQPPLLGQAVERLNAAGGGILLLDEIEKAFPDLLTALLSFDSARTTMFDGTTRDLSRLIIVLTSNLGAAEAARMENSGYTAISRKLRHAAEERFKKEGVARFSTVSCMNVLTYPVQHEITRNLVAHELALQGHHLRRLIEFRPEVVTFLISKGFSPDLGARNIRNCVEYHVGEALRPFLLERDDTLALPPVGESVGDCWSDALTIAVERHRLVASPLSRHPRLAAVGSAAISREISIGVPTGAYPRLSRPKTQRPLGQTPNKMTALASAPETREKSLIDVEILDFGPLYRQAVEHYVSLDPERAAWPREKRERLVIRTECRWGRVNLDHDTTFVLSEKGEGPREPLSATTKAYVALYAEMKPRDGDPGFFETAPFCKVPIDLNLAKTLRAVGIVALDEFIRAKIPEMEAAYHEWRSTLQSARARILAARARRTDAQKIHA
jgi:hypothetical protein